eukprot:CAMPEP_0172307606 /NCGR_PEP_ID=MMETSP1058-20130122/8426_1 /TAXON_ID=83371 /ORGANISM="Detonula confervacea, Strain CCMP 353" /LENGTH=662 /DNA_ID=CAMNT_0013019819 /DNA_START=14 /DNA_END=2002 /DNA_ORIENTATION=+
MAPPSDRKRPFGGETESFIPISSSSSSFQPRTKARLPLTEKTSRDNNSQKVIIDLLNDSDDNQSDDEIEFVKEMKTKTKKGVQFSEIEHEVFYFKRYPIELQSSPPLAAIDENEQGSINNPSGIHPSSEHSRATADFAVLSSHHGRARRKLRHISKYDLRAAVKYGRKVPANPCQRTREPRWKFMHNGLIYITDTTCTREITSYKEAITIEPYPVSIATMEHHTELKRILKEEPYLCTGHTYIIIDQSGSMRNSDVDGFKSRSHAAYGTLSLEFIAEQLSQRPNQDDLFAESVTVIEMREEGEVVFERAPFDWILFNRLLKRKNVAKYAGNYNESLTLVSEMILKEHNNLLEDGTEQGELPNFSLVFLSDGKPSDSKPGCTQKRTEILQNMVDSLKEKFSLFAIGIGAREAEFEVLQSMANTVTENGGSGQFIHAGLSTVKLSQSFSQISTTLTSHRTTLLGDENPQDSNPKQTKTFTMRQTGKIVGKTMPSEKICIGKSHTINRYRFDNALFKRKTYPWNDVGLATHGANGVEIETKPFGKGSERLAYRFHEIKQGENGDCKRVGKTHVAKNSVHLLESETKEAFHEDFCLVQSTAYDLAEQFNDAVRESPLLKSITGETRPPELKFMLCHVYTITDNKTKKEKGYLVEKMLNGKFTKYNR